MPKNMFAAALGLSVALGSVQARAQTFEDDRLTVAVSGFHADSRIRLGASGRARLADLPFSTTIGASGSIAERSTDLRLQARWRLTDRQRLLGIYYEISESGGWNFAESITTDEFPGKRIDLAAEASYLIEFELANVLYEYAVVDTDQWLVGLSGGIHWARLEGTADATAEARHEDRIESRTADFNWVRRRWAPSVGLRVAYAPNERWLIGLQAQGLSTDWGDFTSEDGHYERAALEAEYRVTPHIGVQVGYDWFRLNLRDDLRVDLPLDVVRFNGRAEGDLRVHGPTLGLSVSF